MYGIERVEGSVEERAAEYVPKLLEMQGNGPFILRAGRWAGRWPTPARSGSKRAGADVRFVGLIDAVRAGEEIPQTKEETRARWDRYARFAERTFNVQVPRSRTSSSRSSTTRVRCSSCWTRSRQSGVQIPGGIIEHQRTSYLDNRRDRHREDRALRRARHALHGRPLPRRRDLLRAALRHPQARRRLGRLRRPTWRSCRSGASTSRRSTSRTLRRSART